LPVAISRFSQFAPRRHTGRREDLPQGEESTVKHRALSREQYQELFHGDATIIFGMLFGFGATKKAFPRQAGIEMPFLHSGFRKNVET
jgi:hypothetical protein